MAKQWIVTTSVGLNVRSTPTTAQKNIVGAIANKTIITELESKTAGSTIWIRHNRGGWSVCKETGSHATEYMKAYTAPPTPVVKETTNPVPVVPEKIPSEIAEEDVRGGYLPDDITTWFNYSASLGRAATNPDYTMKNALGVLGLPYQYMPHVDPRITDNPEEQMGLGSIYAEKIISKMPLLLISPGRPNFMSKFGKADKESVLSSILTTATRRDPDVNSLNDVLSKNGRYYTFDYKGKDYYKYVNPMCRTAARFLDLQNYTLDNTPLDEVDWGAYTGNRLSQFADIVSPDLGAVPFYIDSETSISESFSNSTTESMLASTVNSASDMGRELKFLMGYGSAATSGFDVLQDADINDNIQNVQDTVSKLLGKNSFMNSLSTHLATVASGGKLFFPEIWSDSSFSRSYNITIKLVSPDCDKLSIFFNILVPLMHLLALVSPQSLNANPNGYTNPFIVRAVYKGMFNVDMGIITDMSVNKGGEGMWTPDGIPTSMEVNFTVKDLYDSMTVTGMENLKFDTINNTALMDYIATMCGINVFKPEISRAIDMWLVQNFQNRVYDVFKVNIWSGINDAFQNKIIQGIWRR